MEGIATGRLAKEDFGEKKREGKAKRKKGKLSDLLNLNLKEDEEKKGVDPLATFLARKIGTSVGFLTSQVKEGADPLADFMEKQLAAKKR